MGDAVIVATSRAVMIRVANMLSAVLKSGCEIVCSWEGLTLSGLGLLKGCGVYVFAEMRKEMNLHDCLRAKARFIVRPAIASPRVSAHDGSLIESEAEA